MIEKEYDDAVEDTFRVACDAEGCDGRTSRQITATAAFATAYVGGWRRSDDDGDRCPGCLDAAGQTKDPLDGYNELLTEDTVANLREGAGP